MRDLGLPTDAITLRRRAYRAGRRAVIEAEGASGRLFLKVVRPDRTAHLQETHESLAHHVPVPRSAGWSADLGIVAMQAIPGVTLRSALRSGSEPLPGAPAIVALLDRFPQPDEKATRLPGPHERAAGHARLLDAVAPNLTGRVADIVGRVGRAPPQESVAVHGDYHAPQVVVDGETVVGLVDVDTAGKGERINDYATFLAQLSTLSLVADDRRLPGAYGAALIADFDQRVEPANLRLRTGAAVLAFATGPFRVQEQRWPEETERRVALAERWLDAADAV